MQSERSGNKSDSIYEDAGASPGLTPWAKDPVWRWLWCGPAAVAPVRPLAWEPPCATGVAQKRQKKKKKKKKEQHENLETRNKLKKTLKHLVRWQWGGHMVPMGARGSCTPAQFCCEPEAALEMQSVHKKPQNTKWRYRTHSWKLSPPMFLRKEKKKNIYIYICTIFQGS